jgi:MoaA/NifB/PqqE/SkfB family radical SAM enzyme
VQQVRQVLQSTSLRLLACELSLDGMPEYHNRFRGNPRSFEKALETYDALAEIQRDDPRLRIHAISTATHENMEELQALTEFLYDRCPAMDHHNLAIIRGDRKNPSLRGPLLEQYRQLYAHVATVWTDRERGRYGGLVEPMLQWAKCRTIEADAQFVPCAAGRLTGVIYANVDVGLCETHPPVGNLREKPFWEIWDSDEADALRRRIRARACHCTNEVFLWPSIVYQPLQLSKAMVGAKVWRRG